MVSPHRYWVLINKNEDNTTIVVYNLCSKRTRHRPNPYLKVPILTESNNQQYGNAKENAMAMHLK